MHPTRAQRHLDWLNEQERERVSWVERARTPELLAIASQSLREFRAFADAWRLELLAGEKAS